MTDCNGNLRKKFTREQCLVDSLEQLGWASFSQPVQDMENLPAHIHTNAFEVCYIKSGNVEWCVEDQTFSARAGDIFLTFPGEKHGGLNDIMNPCELYWAQVRLSGRDSLAPVIGQQTRLLHDEFASLENRVFPGGHDTQHAFEILIAEHERQDQFSSARTETALIELLIAVLRAHNSQLKSQPYSLQSSTIRKACEIIESRFAEQLRMEEIAAELGISMGTFYRLFAEDTHEKPSEYLARLRLEHAKELLTKTHRTITDIAHSAGFSSSQYFATFFKKSTGLSPRVYRKKAQQSSHGF